MKFIIIHGSFGSPDEHWFPPLKKFLESMGQIVFVPPMPCEDWDELTKLGPATRLKKQSLATWFDALKSTRSVLDIHEKVCFIGHSLGPVFILHLVEKYALQLDSAIFVSPFLNKLNKIWQADKVNESFYRDTFDFKKLQKLIPVSYALYSDNDPYVDISHALYFANKMNSAKIIVRGAGHINHESNYSLIAQICKTRIPDFANK